MTDTSQGELRSHLVTDAIRRHLWLVLVPALILAPLGFLWAETRQANYQSTVRVLLRPLPGNPFAPDSAGTSQQQTVALTTESLVAVSAPVVDRVNPSLPTPIVVGDGTLASSVPTNSQVVQVVFRGTSPEAAQNGAGVVAKAYLDHRAELATATQKTRIDSLTAQAGAIRPRLETASKAASAAVPAPEAAQQVQLYATQLSAVETAIEEAKAVPLTPGEVIQAPSVPEAPVGLGPILIGLLAGIVGLGIGLLLALWRERAVSRLGPELQSVGGVPVIASRGSEQAPGDLRAYLAPQLRDAVLSAVNLPAAVTVAAVKDRDQGSAVAAALAESVSASGARVVLVGTPGTPAGAGRPGLAELLRGDRVDAEALLVSGAEGTRVLPAGSGGDTADDLLAGPRMAQLLGSLRGLCDVVVVDAPAASTPVALGSARGVDAAIVVATEGSDTHESVRRIAERADLLNVPVLGVALVPRLRRGGHSVASGPAGDESTRSGRHSAAQEPAGAGTTERVAASGVTRAVGAERGSHA